MGKEKLNGQPDDHQRSQAIDYMRAFSILWVMAYHFVALPIFKTGLHGVLEFFIISGYCIAISAEHSRSAWHFYGKRVGRLMPALIVCGLISVTLKNIAPWLIDPSRQASFKDAFVTWISLPALNTLRIPYTYPDGAYWSLAIEFKFYALIFGAIAIGLRRLALFAVCAFVVLKMFILPDRAHEISYFPFFIAGLSIAELHRGRVLTGAAGLVFALVSMLVAGFDTGSIPMGISTCEVLWVGSVVLLLAGHFSVPAKVASALRPLSYIGVISYPLYLLHQDIGHMLLNLVNVSDSGNVLSAVETVLVISLTFIPLAAAVHAFVERPFVEPLTSLLTNGIRNRAEPNSPQTGALT
jgi:peptidoglycan/LPS O-acetylase OafA/YrhL